MKKLKIILLLFISLLHFFCSDGDVKKEIVARVGDQSISFSDLEISFLLDPQYLKRTPLSRARQSQLDYLVQNKYYYLAAEKMNLENDPLIHQRINYIKEHEVLKAFIKKKYLDSIKVRPDKMRIALNRWSKLLLVENYYIKDPQEAEVLQEQLAQGLIDAGFLIDQKGEDLGWITFGDLDPLLEEEIYNLGKNGISDVVKSSYGYHLLRVSDSRLNEDFQNLSDRLRIQKLSEIIRRRKADVAIKADLKKLAAGQQIQVNNRLLEVIVREIRATATEEVQTPTRIVPPLTNRDLINLEFKIKDIYNETLVKFNNEMPVGTFMERLKEMPPFHRPYIKGRSFLLKSIIDMMRNDLFLERAKREGFAEKESVKENYNLQVKDFLAREFGLRINSKVFQEQDPLIWREYEQAYFGVKEENELIMYKNNLFPDQANPDSIMTNAPVPVFMKNRYVW